MVGPKKQDYSREIVVFCEYNKEMTSGQRVPKSNFQNEFSFMNWSSESFEKNFIYDNTWYKGTSFVKDIFWQPQLLKHIIF